jgi:hypothetical protein
MTDIVDETERILEADGLVQGQSNASTTPAQHQKPLRVLACILCQQRKIKCDRKFPCANCVKLNAQCIQATLTPRRRRRAIPERVLLDRLRTYETLLRQNDVKFESLSKEFSGTLQESPNAEGADDSENEHGDAVAGDSTAPSATADVPREYEPKYVCTKYTELIK